MSYRSFGWFGQTSPVGWSSSQVNNAATANAAKLTSGQLLPTTFGAPFAFDPTQPQFLYITQPYWGNGPPGYSGVPAVPGQFLSSTNSDGSYQNSWPGQISKATWISSLPPDQQAAMQAAAQPTTTTNAGLVTTDSGTGSITLYVAIGIIVVLLLPFIVHKKKNKSSGYYPPQPYPPYPQPYPPRKKSRKSQKSRR